MKTPGVIRITSSHSSNNGPPLASGTVEEGWRGYSTIRSGIVKKKIKYLLRYIYVHPEAGKTKKEDFFSV